MKTTLERIGLEKKEADVYIAILKLGTSTATSVSRETQIERTLVYRTIDKLIGKGLVNYIIENKVRRFNAVEPEKLLIQLKEKENELKSILPKLKEASRYKNKGDPRVEIYRGLKGIKSLVREIYILKQDYRAILSEYEFPQLKLFFEQLMGFLEKENIHEKLLLKEGLKVDIVSKNTEIRYLPKEHSFLATTGVCGDKVAIILWTEPFLAIGIESKELANTYKSYFDILWKIARK